MQSLVNNGLTEANDPPLSRTDMYYAWRGMRLSERAANLLAYHGVATPEAALAMGAAGLMQLKHVGRTLVAEILTRCEAIVVPSPPSPPVSTQLAEIASGRLTSSQLAGVSTGRLIEELLRRGYKLTIEHPGPATNGAGIETMD